MKVPVLLNAPAQGNFTPTAGIGGGGDLGGGKAIGRGIEKLGEAVAFQRKKLEQDQTNLDRFELGQTNIDEINYAQEAFKAAQEQPQDNPSAFANNFVQALTERHKTILDVQKGYGYKPEQLQELDTQLATLRSHMLNQSLNFQNTLEQGKAFSDFDNLTDSFSVYAANNPNAMITIKDSLHEAIFNHPYLTDTEKQTAFDQRWERVRTIGAQAYVAAHPNDVINQWDPKGIYAPPPIPMVKTEGGTASFAPESYSRQGAKQAIAQAETGGRNIRNLAGGSAAGEYQFTAGTFASTYKQVYGVAPPHGNDATTYPKEVREALMEHALTGYETALKSADLPVDTGNTYILHALGPSTGVKFLQANPNQSAAAFFQRVSPKTASAIVSQNGNLYKGTVADAVNKLRNRVGSAPVTYQGGGDAGQVPVVRGNVGPTGVLAQAAGVDTQQHYDAHGAPLPVATGSVPTVPQPIIPATLPLGIRTIAHNPDGSVSTVRTISIGTDQGEVLIPTVINGKVVSNEEAIQHYKDTGEHLGVFKTPEDATKYAEELHNQHEAMLHGAFDTTNPALAVLHGEERLKYLGIAYSIRRQREEAVVQQTRMQDGADKIAAREAHDKQLNDLLNGLNDGTKTPAAIEQARTEGWLTDFDEIHKAQSIVAARQKVDTDMANLGAYLNGGATWNPYDKGAQDAAETWFSASMDPQRNGGKPTPDPLALAEHIWRASGIMPKQGTMMIRGALASPDQNKVAAAASIASNVLRQNPRAFAGQDGEADIRESVAAYESVIYGTSSSAQEAASKVQHLHDPKVDRAFKPDDPVRAKAVKQITDMDVNKIFRDRLGASDSWMPNFIEGAPAQFASPAAREEARATFGEAYLQHYDRYKDDKAANQAAVNEIQRLYGVVDGRIVKYPPSKAYHAVAGGHSYIMQQAQEDVKSYTNMDIPSEDIWLDAAQSGATSEAYRNGQQVPYQIFYRTWQDGQPVIHKMPKLFVADQGRAQAAQAVKAGQEHKTEQTRQKIIEQYNTGYAPGM